MSNTVSKNKTANTGKYAYKYTDIAQIHEFLESIGASYYQYTERIGDDDYIVTVRIINGEEKAPLRGCRIVDAKLNGVVNPAQEQGSALTYARRYSLLMAFGLATDDDDAQMLTQRPKKAAKSEQKEKTNKVAPDTHEDSVVAKKAHLKAMCTPTQWSLLQDKFGTLETWTEELVDKLTKQMKERMENNAEVDQTR